MSNILDENDFDEQLDDAIGCGCCSDIDSVKHLKAHDADLRAEVERLTKERDEYGRALLEQPGVAQKGRQDGFDLGREQGRAEERAKVVAWLRTGPAQDVSCRYLSGCIERGDHDKDGDK